MTIESRLAAIRARAEKLDGGLPCAWCDIPAVGLARHNDGLLNPSCGEDGHGFDWQAAGDPRTIAGALTDLPALLAAVQAVREKIPSLLEAAWDDGNALGLDGWIGPERGEEPDEHAIRRRAQLRGKLVDEACEALTAALEVKG